ncbi:MAG: hypothetical protein ACXVP0_02765, partial [Bacteroidia bacterium]
CSTSEMNPLITICHFPGSNQPAQVITIPQNLWPSHQAHGDHMGNCSSSELVPVSKPPVITNQPQINIAPRTNPGVNMNAPAEQKPAPQLQTQPQSQPQPQLNQQIEGRPLRPR